MTTIEVPLDSKLRLLTFADEQGRARLGVVRPDGHVTDVAETARHADRWLCFDGTSMRALIEGGAEALAEVRELAELGLHNGFKVSEAHILPPLPRLNGNIFCVGWNYVEHFSEGAAFRDPNQKLPEHPLFFSKGVAALNGPFDPIPYDAAISAQVDWEAELGVVIGRRGKNITEFEALDYVFGYTAINDVSARDIQKARHGGQWLKGKSLDGTAPMGPWIVPAGDFDASAVRIITRVNGVVKQDGNTRDMYFNIPRIIAELSRGMTLQPGDVISTGTPSGVGMGRTPPEWLKPGDVLETEIEGIGTMRNVIHEA
ncbi:Ureidoglycolate lyase [Rhodomicrobium vannielii ATCC 17100]|uniref:Ureidoglycolate lyase n=2 Tax=Rhodomicrobium TaxID=1068 RepID=E3I6D4_RHOVT|nr:fumarylacetoacetate hydrolase family protein [Rhodomicrobium vannielii]ADP69495.1 Ureidoglycolate lyase [Rhodomicrobium vannielii ATCC 17100]